MKVRVGIVGVTGYSGLELIRLLLRHPAVDCAAVMASEATGERPLEDIHPQLRGLSRLHCQPRDAARLAAMGIDTAFLCTPNEVSHELAPRLIAAGVKVIDFSGAFRLKDAACYPAWYGFRHEAPDLLRQAVYGLPEWKAEYIARARLVANPGCYPTSVLLPLLPLVRAGMVDRESEILCDSKSGVTGAGRTAKTEMLFGEISENFRPYSPVLHRHAPEMCQELGWDDGRFTFVPHLLPVNRGILSTLYISFRQAMSAADLEAACRERYANSPFVRILGDLSLPELRAVNHTNFCDIGWRMTGGGKRAVVFSALDNLIKGAAGQAVQNFNLMHGFNEGLGLAEARTIAIHD
jgi:N-acetyl-gamma-glutamyl-phosphate reductase